MDIDTETGDPMEYVQHDQFLLFGDSITEGSSTQERGFALQAQLQADYIRRLDVINRGYSGYNTVQALNILPGIIPPPSSGKLRFMTLFFGANDACIKGSESHQHVPLELYSQNIRTILTHPLIKAQSPRLILITPPPVDEHQFLAYARAVGHENIARRAAVTKSYGDAARAVAKELGVAVLDLWSVMMAKAGWKEGEPLAGSLEVEQSAVLKECLYDGLHLNPAAYKIIYAELTNLIASRWPDQVPEKLEKIFPGWMEAPGLIDL